MKWFFNFLFLAFLVFIGFELYTNKTFFTDIYEANGTTVFIPKYSFFAEESDHYTAKFYTLKTKKAIDEEVDGYLKGFDSYENDSSQGYINGRLLIRKYDVEDKTYYRLITIDYELLD